MNESELVRARLWPNEWVIISGIVTDRGSTIKLGLGKFTLRVPTLVAWRHITIDVAGKGLVDLAHQLVDHCVLEQVGSEWEITIYLQDRIVE